MKAPSCHEFGFKEIDKLAFEMGVERIVHGHHHINYQDQINNKNQTIIVDGVGVALAKCINIQGEVVEKEQ
ncbi:MAG: hypothetical protein COA63_000680 [Methylophaga sp.]|nr:hypothetical protein [Methylophaga sp.]